MAARRSMECAKATVQLVATKAIKKNGVLATLPSDLALALCDPDEDEADHAACAKNFYEFKYEEQFGDYVRGSVL